MVELCQPGDVLFDAVDLDGGVFEPLGAERQLRVDLLFSRCEPQKKKQNQLGKTFDPIRDKRNDLKRKWKRPQCCQVSSAT